VELRDALQRIVKQHWVLIASCVVVGLVLGALLARNPATYTASTRLVLGTADPTSRVESNAIADTGKAIASSQAEVSGALRDAHVDRDANSVAKHVSVKPLGTSSVVQLTVSDKNRYAAQAIANALTKRVIAVRKDVLNGQVQQVISDLDQRISVLTAKIATLDQNAVQRDLLLQQRATLQSEKISILSAGAQRPTARVISAAVLPTHKDSSPFAQETVLGALLGLVLGIGIAGLKETFRPTLVGSDSLAREFDTPLLGTIDSQADDQRGRQTLARIAVRLRLAAETAESQSVGLVPVGHEVELGLLAATLDELANVVGVRAAQRMGEAVPRADASVPRFRIRPYGLLEGRGDASETALVLVSPSVVKKEEIDEVSHLLRVAGAPVVGLITYKPPRERVRFELRKVRTG